MSRESDSSVGYVVERRRFVSGSVAAALVAAFGGACPARAATSKLAWAQFLEQAVPVARSLLAEGAAPDEYLLRIAAFVSRLDAAPDTRLFPYEGVAPRVSFGPSYTGGPFLVIQWRLLPGAVLPAHNHPGYSVCTLGLEGECRLRNFDVEGSAPPFDSKGSFRVRLTHDELLTPGRLNTLSPTRDNIHWFEAGPHGARGIDIGTLHAERDTGFSHLEIADRPTSPDGRTFEARWRPK